MSSPMPDLPDHMSIGVDVDGNGPVQADDPRFHTFTCWCGDKDCTIWQTQDLS